MILTELRYIVAVARERHFGRAAEACFVSQRRLSVSIKKLEEALDVKIFERGASEVSVTSLGDEIVRQAIEHVPQMPLLLQENFSAKLPQMLRTGELDCAIMAEPFPAAVPRRHPLTRRKSISTDGLKSETLLRPGAGHCFRAPQVHAPRGDRGAAQCDLRVPAGRREALVVMRRSKVRLVVAPVTHTRSITWNSPASATPA